ILPSLQIRDPHSRPPRAALAASDLQPPLSTSLCRAQPNPSRVKTASSRDLSRPDGMAPSRDAGWPGPNRGPASELVPVIAANNRAPLPSCGPSSPGGSGHSLSLTSWRACSGPEARRSLGLDILPRSRLTLRGTTPEVTSLPSAPNQKKDHASAVIHH